MQQAYSLPTALKPGRWLLLAGLLLAAVPVAQAQLAHGSANAQNVAGTFTDLGTTGTAIATVNTDDANSTAQAIGFAFSYNGASFTQFVFNTNGLIRLGSAAPSAVNMFAQYEAGMLPGVAPIESTNAADINLLIPFNIDLEAGTGGTEYRVATTGTAPNQVCTIQWKNVSDKAGSAAAGNPKQYAALTFQVKLYQTTNVIEFVYGPSTAATGTATGRYPTVGIKGSGSSGGQTVLANKEASVDLWSTTAFITGMYGEYTTHNFRSTVRPDAGRTYRFSPCSPLVITSFPYTENFDALVAKQSLYDDTTYGPIPTDLTSPLPCGATTFDANADANSWFVLADNSDYTSASTAPNALVYAFNLDGNTAANDWYFTPGLSLRAGYRYQLQFKYLAGDSGYPEALEVKYGTAATPAGQTNTLFTNNAISNSMAYVTTTAANVAAITPTANGIYYIGFHATSIADQYLLFLDDMQVTESPVLGVRNATNSVFTAEASPVPFGERLSLTINTLKPGPAHLTLRDALGRTVRQSTTASLVGASTVAVPEVSNLPSGVYFLTVEQGGASQLLRVAHE
jgi:hypothetical protein